MALILTGVHFAAWMNWTPHYLRILRLIKFSKDEDDKELNCSPLVSKF